MQDGSGVGGELLTISVWGGGRDTEQRSTRFNGQTIRDRRHGYAQVQVQVQVEDFAYVAAG